MNKHLHSLAVAILALATHALQAGPITIPNASFESPTVPYVSITIDAWQQVPGPESQRTGIFANQPPPDPSYIDNCDGNQSVFIFAYPQVAVFQDYDSTDWANPTPTHAFDATFEPGKSYTLTVGVLGGTNLTIPMPDGPTLELSLYYRDGAGNPVTVAATVITNNGLDFSNALHFLDFQVLVPAVRANDPWAGQHIGIKLLSTISSDQVSGYWDLDNVRLSSTVTPTLVAPVCTNNQFAFTLQSEPGLRFEILASTNLALPLSNWTSLGFLTNDSGATPFPDPATNLTRRFYRALQVP